MEIKLFKTCRGRFIDVYEVEYEGMILWFSKDDVESASVRYKTRNEDDDDLWDKYRC